MPPAKQRVEMYTNDQAHRFTAVAAFNVGLQGRRREVPYDIVSLGLRGRRG